LKNEQPYYLSDILFSSIEIIKQIADNLGKVLVTFEENKKIEEVNDELKMNEYFGALTHIFTKYFSIHERERSPHMS
jgi:hypothetical protein